MILKIIFCNLADCETCTNKSLPFVVYFPTYGVFLLNAAAFDSATNLSTSVSYQIVITGKKMDYLIWGFKWENNFYFNYQRNPVDFFDSVENNNCDCFHCHGCFNCDFIDLEVQKKTNLQPYSRGTRRYLDSNHPTD